MPWNIRKRDGKFCVFKEGASSPITCHETRGEATAHLRALYANEPKGQGAGETKEVRARAEVKADAPDGSVRAVFSTFGVVDHDGDVVLPSTFTDGQPVPMVWAHDWTRPVGKGVIRVDGERAVFDGTFNLKTSWGRDAYEAVKDAGDLQEYSWGFKTTDTEYGEKDGRRVRFIKAANVYEVSPVLVGAGIGTGTLAVKAQGAAGPGEKGISIAPLDESFEDRIDSLNDAVQSLMPGGPFDASPYCCVVATFDDYCVVCVRKDGWDGEETYYRVPYTLDDLGEPVLGTPEQVTFTITPVAGETTYANQAQKLLADGRAFLDRTRALVALRREQRKSGRVLSTATRDRLATHPESLRKIADEIAALLDETAPPEKGADPPDIVSLFAAWQHTQARLNGGLFV